MLMLSLDDSVPLKLLNKMPICNIFIAQAVFE